MALVKTTEIAPAVVTGGHFAHLYQSPEVTGFIICKSPAKLQQLVTALSPGKTIHFVSDGDWSTHDLVMSLLPLCRPAELYITTYAIRELPVRQLIMAMEKKDILAVNMLLDNRARVRTPDVYQLASFNLTKICLTHIHAKVTVLRGPDISITIMGSANWTQNPRIEVGILSRDDALAQFHIDWITKAMNDGELFE